MARGGPGDPPPVSRAGVVDCAPSDNPAAWSRRVARRCCGVPRQEAAMILVRNVFHCEFGKAGEVARALTANADQMPEGLRLPTRVLTDLSGPFDTVVLETVAESIDEYLRQLRAMFADPAAMQGPNPFAGVVRAGHREYYTIEGER